MAAKISVPATTLNRCLKSGVLNKTRSAVKPVLTCANKVERVKYCESFINQEGNFKDIHERIDIDEKWWYITKVKTGYIVAPGEKAPDRKVKHKSHIPKVMYLAASAHPRKNPTTGEWWDGKIGTWSFVNYVPAKRSSKRRARGTIEAKCVKIGRKVFVDMCLKELLPAVEEKWPAWCPKVIRLQQDNATPHPPPGKDDMLNHRIAEMASRGWDVQFVCQPPNSPDCNVKDLAFLEQSMQLKTPRSPIQLKN